MHTGEFKSKELLIGALSMLLLVFLLGASTQDGKLITDTATTITGIDTKVDTIDTNVDTINTNVEVLGDHVHSVQLVYPNLAAAVSVVSTNGVGTWTPGADTEVIPINTIASQYDIHFVSVATIGANGSFQLDLYQGADGAGTKIASLTFARNDAFTRSFPLPITTPVLAANRRVYAKLADNDDAGTTVTFKVWYHTY